MGLADIILNISEKASKKYAEKEVLGYVMAEASKKLKKPEDVLFELDQYKRGKFMYGLADYAASGLAQKVFEELPTKACLGRNEVAKKIEKLGIGLLLFQLATGIEAREQIAAFSTDNIPGYHSYRGLAFLVCGGEIAFDPKKKGTEMTQASECIKRFVEEKGMPLLTIGHRDYARRFSLKYVKEAPEKELREKVTIGHGYTIKNRPFLRALSKKLSKSRKLQYEFFRKWAGIKAVSQISPGSLTGLAAVMTGHTMTVRETGRYLRNLAREYRMPEEAGK